MDFLSKLGELLEDIEKAIETVWEYFEAVLSFLTNDFDNYYSITKIAENMHNFTSNLIGSTSSYTDAVAYKVYAALIPIAAGLLLIYFAMHITDLIITEKFNVENFLKSILYLFIALWIMDNAYEFILKIYETICAYSNTGGISSVTNDVVSKLDPIAKINSNNYKIDSIPELISKLVGFDVDSLDSLDDWIKFLAEELLNAIINFVFLPINVTVAIILCTIMEIRLVNVAGKRAEKIAIHMALAPIAFANCFGDAMTRSGGFKHFLRIISLFVQGPIILIGVRLTVYIINNLNSDLIPMPYFVMLFILNINIKKVLKQSESLTDELFGI